MHNGSRLSGNSPRSPNATDLAIDHGSRGRVGRLRPLSGGATRPFHVAGDVLISRYRQHERLFPKTDAKDRHVAAAAVAARKHAGVGVVTVITWNLKDFNRRELAEVGLAVENPDTFLCGLIADSPGNVVSAFLRMRDNLRNPPKTTLECADTLFAQGLTAFSGLIKAKLENQ